MRHREKLLQAALHYRLPGNIPPLPKKKTCDGNPSGQKRASKHMDRTSLWEDTGE